VERVQRERDGVALDSQGPATGRYPVIGSIVREDPRLDQLVPRDAQIEVIASGLDWAEGPVWVKAGGYLLFSDVPRNVIHTMRKLRGAPDGLKVDRDGNLWATGSGRYPRDGP
jgi:sugar lactone lactonase YvrE